MQKRASTTTSTRAWLPTGQTDCPDLLTKSARINFWPTPIRPKAAWWAWWLICVMTVMAGIGIVSPHWSRAQQVEQVSFLPHWVPQSQFAGYYVAQDQGFFREAGLEVVLLQGGPGRESFDYLKKKEAVFATGWLSTAIKNKTAGLEIMNISQMAQDSALMLVAFKSAGVINPADLNGKRVSFWGGDFELPAMAFLKKYALSVVRVPQYYSMNLFLKGGVEAASAMWYNEYYSVINSGVDPGELTIFLFRDYGISFPEDGLYTLKETYQQRPEICRRFVRASLKGWNYAFAHKEKAVDIVMKYTEAANVDTNRAHQRWMLARMEDLMKPKRASDRLGYLTLEAYLQIGQTLMDLGLIDHIPPFDDFFVAPQ